MSENIPLEHIGNDHAMLSVTLYPKTDGHKILSQKPSNLINSISTGQELHEALSAASKQGWYEQTRTTPLPMTGGSFLIYVYLRKIKPHHIRTIKLRSATTPMRSYREIYCDTPEVNLPFPINEKLSEQTLTILAVLQSDHWVITANNPASYDGHAHTYLSRAFPGEYQPPEPPDPNYNPNVPLVDIE
jgi:hypothetical protein